MLEGPGVDSEEKHEPVSDIDIAVVDRLKALDPKRPIREADMPVNSSAVIRLSLDGHGSARQRGSADARHDQRCTASLTARLPLTISPRMESADGGDLSALVEGEFDKPVRIVVFNTAEGWSRDVTVDMADELRRRQVEFGEVPDAILDFMDVNRR
jgi:hypothetical protein